MAALARLAVGSVFAEGFRIVELLAETGTGAVYAVEEVSTGTARALELLPPERVSTEEQRQRFMHEARTGARIESDHVAQVVGAGIDGATGAPWLVTELLRGTDLGKHVEQNGPRPASEVREIFAQLGHALAAAHDTGIVHGDLSPENVFLAVPRRAGAAFMVKVRGFGISKELGPVLSPAADIGSMGLLAFFALTGSAGSRAAHLLPPGFDAWFARCTAREPSARFPSARQALAALDDVLAGRVAAPPPYAAPPPPPAYAAPPPPPPYAAPPLPAYSASPTGSSALWWIVPLVVGFLFLVVGVGAVMGVLAMRKKSHATASTRRDGGPPRRAIATAAWSDATSPIPVSSDDPTWGDRRALVTVVVFSDFQCPFCRKLVPTIEEAKRRYGPTTLRVVWKNQPLAFHTRAMPAAEAGRAVFELEGAAAFWDFHDSAFASAGDAAALSDAKLEDYALAAGLRDLAGFRAGLASHRWQPRVERDAALAKSVGASGTPTCFVNGVVLTGAQPIATLAALIDAEKAKAEARVLSGTPLDRVYVVMSEENRKAAPPAAKSEDEKADDRTIWRVPVGSSPTLGAATALVTIVEFSDFQCPFCQKAEATVTLLREKYGEKVRIVWKNEPLPFHPRAEPSAELALEARAQRGNAGFWTAHDKLFLNQKALADEDLYRYAAELGLNVVLVRSAIQDKKHKAEIDADAALADDFQASGTPHFFVNGRRLVGSQPQATFEKIIDEEITKATALLARGVAATQIYDTLTRDGRGPPELERKAVAVAPNAPWRGGAGAKVVIQEFGDFQCPFCNRAEDTLRQVTLAYGERVKIVWRDLPLSMHPDAALAAQAAREAYRQKGPKAFWAMHDKMFANQKALDRGALDGYARDLGLDMNLWDAALESGSHKAVIDADVRAAQDAGITGTPAFIINGYYLGGAEPFAKMKKLIDRALAEAR